tara:strand:+ start:112 stop:609 length:498 start_codon:yes stop_codon:yes gene_type:complete
MITVKKNFLDASVIESISKYVGENMNKPMWNTNVSWQKGIVKGGGQVATTRLEQFDDIMKEQYVKSDEKFKDMSVECRFYIWNRGSHIPWHNDKKYKFGSTIYLNKGWHRDDGGLFLWEDENQQIHAEVPEFNKMVLNDDGTSHAVSMISNQSPQLRTTLQIWIK